MSLPSTLVWELQPGGNASDQNGGAFDAAARATGTDMSQLAPVLFTDLAIDASDATKVTSATIAFATTHTGNTIRIASGTGFTGGLYCIKSASAGVAVLDRGCGTTGSTGGTGRLGGPLASFGQLAADMAVSNLAFVKAGAYTEGSTVAFSLDAGQGGAVQPGGAVPPTRIIGYSSVRSDYATPGLSRPVLSVQQTNGGLSLSGNGWVVQNLEVTSTGDVLSNAIGGGSYATVFAYCKASGFSSAGIATPGWVHACEVTNDGFPAANPYNGVSATLVTDCYIHDSKMQSGAIQAVHALRNVITRLTGYGVGIDLLSATLHIACFNTVHNISANDGIRIRAGASGTFAMVQGNILSTCGVYGIEMDVAGDAKHFQINGNAYYSNTEGNKNNLDDDGTVNPVNAYLTYDYPGDVLLSTDPFTSSAGNDFSLNDAEGGGALLKGTGPVNSWPGLGSTGGLDFGAVQSLTGGGGLTAGDIAKAVWQSGLAGDNFSAAGSVGAVIKTNLDAKVSDRLATSGYVSPPSASDNATAVWSTAQSGFTATGTFGNLLDAKVSSVSLDGSGGPSASDVATAVWANGTRTLSGFTFPVVLTSDYDPAKSSASQASVNAVKAQTDQLTFSGGDVQASIGTDTLISGVVAALSPFATGTVSSAVTPTTTTFSATGSTLAPQPSSYVGSYVFWTSGVLKTQKFLVSAHTVSGSVHQFSFSLSAPLKAAPTVGDTFEVV